MFSTTSGASAVVLALLLLAAFIAAGIAFSFIQTILVIAIAASAAMLSAFIAVASSRDGH